MEKNLGKEFVANLLVAFAQERVDNEIKIKTEDNIEVKKSAEKENLYYWLLSRF